MSYISLLNQSQLESLDDASIDFLMVNNELDVSSATVVGLPVDNITIQNTANILAVKNGGIGTSKIANNSITDEKINSTRLNNLSGNVDVLTVRVNNLSGNIGGLTVRVNNLSGNLINVGNRITNLSGTVVSLNRMNTKGDLLSYSTSPQRLAVGSNNQALIADSSQTLGLKWGNVVGGIGSSTTSAVVLWNDTSGASLRNSSVLISSSGSITGAIRLNDNIDIGRWRMETSRFGLSSWSNYIEAFNGSSMTFISSNFFDFGNSGRGLLADAITSHNAYDLTLQSAKSVNPRVIIKNNSLLDVSGNMVCRGNINLSGTINGKSVSNIVVNNSSSTVNNIVRFADNTGKNIKNSSITLSDSNDIDMNAGSINNVLNVSALTGVDLVLTTANTANIVGCLRNLQVASGRTLLTNLITTTSTSTDLNINTATDANLIRLNRNTYIDRDIYTTAYSAGNWTVSLSDRTNLALPGSLTYTWNYHRRLGKLVFCTCRVSGMTVTTANISTVCSVILPVNMVSATNGVYGSNCFIYHSQSSSNRITIGAVVDWGGGESNKVGIIFDPVQSGTMHYMEISMIYETA